MMLKQLLGAIMARKSGRAALVLSDENRSVNGAQFPHKSGVDVLTTVRDNGFGFGCWTYL
jgi:hypothetical protein